MAANNVLYIRSEQLNLNSSVHVNLVQRLVQTAVSEL